MENFLNQIEEDIQIIKNYSKYDSKLDKDEYAFNYWILEKLYNMEEESLDDNITDYNDKGIDCFVHFEDNKELYIIQNKYYSLDVNIKTSDVSDFLTRPLASLLKKEYKNRELQKIFLNAIEDNEYKIYFHFYTTSKSDKKDIKNLIDKFKNDNNKYKCFMEAKYFNIYDIKQLYYGETYKQNKNFKFDFTTLNKATFAVVKAELGIGVRPAYYIITPISEIYRLYKKAQEEDYQIFNNNIREWLGDNPINKGIVKTLESETDMKDFLYYNNGITMIYESSGTSNLRDGKRIIPLINPQIVNGCQTTNSIYQVLNKYTEKEIGEKFKSAYVMIKALQKDTDTDNQFYENVMKYTNKQNSISEKAFSSKNEYFYRIQKEFEKRGFLLEIKPSDKNKFKQEYSKKLTDIIDKANERAKNFNIKFSKLSEISIPLEKLLQVNLAFILDGHAAYTKKNNVLKFGSSIYKDFSLSLLDILTIDSILNIYLLYQKVEREKKSGDGRLPIPYYMISFLGDYFKTSEDSVRIKIKKEELDKIFDSEKNIEKAYDWLKVITNKYYKEYIKDGKSDYNRMIKQKINVELVNEIKENYIEFNKNKDDILEIIGN